MKVLVTGGAGFIGAQVGRALQERGDALLVLDNFNAYYDPKLKRARVCHLLAPNTTVIRLDITDGERLTACFQKLRPEAVIHLAAWPGVRPSRSFASLYSSQNVLGTVNVFEACKTAGVSRVLYASSSSVYGPSAPVPSPEDAAQNTPPSGYGVSKRAGELYAELYHRLDDLSITCLRYFTVYGPWHRPDMGLMRFTESIVQGRSLRLFARSADGREVRRGFTDVRDIVRGTLLALDRHHPFAIVNMGSGDAVPLRRVVAALEAAIGQPAKITEQVLPANEEVQTAADGTRARDLLGFSPSTRVEEGVQPFVSWYLEEYQRLFPSGLTPSQYWKE